MENLRFITIFAILSVAIISCDKDRFPEYSDVKLRINNKMTLARGFYSLAYPNDLDHVGIWIDYPDPESGKLHTLIIRRVPAEINREYSLFYSTNYLFFDSLVGTPKNFFQPEPYVFLQGFHYEDDFPSTIYTPDATKQNTIGFSKVNNHKLHGQLKLNLYKMHYKRDSLPWTNPGPEHLNIVIPDFQFDKAFKMR